MGDVEKVEDNESQVIIPGTPQKSRKRKLIKSSKKIDKVEEKNYKVEEKNDKVDSGGEE